jgi:hypothetical protein
MLAVLGSFATALALEHVARLHVDVVILAVVLAMTLSRASGRGKRRDRRAVLLSLGLLPLISVAALEAGGLLRHSEALGDAIMVLSFSGAIWVRRFGPLATRAGTIATLPFLAVLITPVPAPVSDSRWWAAVIALIAAVWVTAVHLVGSKVGWLPASPDNPAPPPATRRQRAGLPASTKMAVQLAAALSAAFALGHLTFGRHWTWVVVTVYVVSAGNRGRGDVLYKSMLRVAGATVGTAAATLIAGSVPPGSRLAVVAIFCVLAVGTWLRTYNYAFWAMCMTAALALLYGYFGESGGHILGVRMLAILLGAALGIASAWLLLPVRTHDVLRRRVADALAALTEVLQAIRGDLEAVPSRAAQFSAAVRSLDQIAAPLLLHGRFTRGIHPSDAIAAIRRCAVPVATLEQYAREHPEQLVTRPAAGHANRTLREVGDVRRALIGSPRPARDRPGWQQDGHPVHASFDAITSALDTVHAAMTRTRSRTRQQPG